VTVSSILCWISSPLGIRLLMEIRRNIKGDKEKRV